MDIKKRNPKMNNVYCEIGSSFGLLAVENPADVPASHRQEHQVLRIRPCDLGNRLLWWGSPQWAIDLFKRFQFTDEMSEKFGYRS